MTYSVELEYISWLEDELEISLLPETMPILSLSDIPSEVESSEEGDEEVRSEGSNVGIMLDEPIIFKNGVI